MMPMNPETLLRLNCNFLVMFFVALQFAPQLKSQQQEEEEGKIKTCALLSLSLFLWCATQVGHAINKEFLLFVDRLAAFFCCRLSFICKFCCICILFLFLNKQAQSRSFVEFIALPRSKIKEECICMSACVCNVQNKRQLVHFIAKH